MQKFEETDSVYDVICRYQCTARYLENIAAVCNNVEENSYVSIPRRSQQLRLSYRTTWCLLHRNLHLHLYNIQLTREPRDHFFVVNEL